MAAQENEGDGMNEQIDLSKQLYAGQIDTKETKR